MAVAENRIVNRMTARGVATLLLCLCIICGCASPQHKEMANNHLSVGIAYFNDGHFNADL